MIVRARRESWPLRERFAISRGSRVEAEVVVAEVEVDGHRGRGECTPYARYGESVEGVLEEVLRAGEALEAVRTSRDDGGRRTEETGRGKQEAGGGRPEGIRKRLQELLPPGAARNALDAALWDLEARRSGSSVRTLLEMGAPRPVPTFVTLGVDDPASMASAARKLEAPSRLKLKMAGKGDLERVAAVREAAPGARIMLDANEAWTVEGLEGLLPRLQELGVELVEQPLPADSDGALEELDSPIPLCADESCHDRATLERVASRYEYVNIKLDKTGGLTEALALAEESRRLELGIMVGCMLGTSLAMAPALLVAEGADVVDLDAPLLLSEDRRPGLLYRRGEIAPPPPGLWGDGVDPPLGA